MKKLIVLLLAILTACSPKAENKEIKENTAIFGKVGGTKQLAPKHIQTVTITPEEYSQWVKKSMPDDLYSTVVERYGDFPGKMFRMDVIAELNSCGWWA